MPAVIADYFYRSNSLQSTVSNKTTVHHTLTLAQRTRLVLAPAIIEDRMQSRLSSRGVSLCTTLQQYCCCSITLPYDPLSENIKSFTKPDKHNVTAMLPQQDRATTTGNMRRKLSEVLTCGF